MKIFQLIRKNFVLIIFILIVIVATLLDGSPFVWGDGWGYYHTGKQIVSNGQLVADVKPDYYEYSMHGLWELNGKYVTRYLPGNSVVWGPFMGVASFFDSGTKYDDYYKGYNGHSLAEGLAILSASVTYTVIGLLALYKALRILNFSKSSSVIAIATSFLSTYAWHYVFETPAVSHAYDLFGANVLLYLILLLARERVAVKRRWLVLIGVGVVSGIITIVRPTNVFIVIALILYLTLSQKKNLGIYIKQGIYIGIGALPLFLFFLLFNYVTFGNPFANGYAVLGSTQFRFDEFYLFDLLFSNFRGWFVYSPLMLISIISLLFYVKAKLIRFTYTLLPIVLVVLIYSFWPIWYGGAGLGQRFFIVLMPFTSVGAAFLIDKIMVKAKLWLRICMYIILGILTLYSSGLTLLYRFTPTNTLTELFPRDNYMAGVSEEVQWTPFDMFRYHELLLKESSSFKEYKHNLRESYRGRYSLIFLISGKTEPVIRIQPIDEDSLYIHIIPNSTNRKSVFSLNVMIDYKGKSVYGERIGQIGMEKYQRILIKCQDEQCVSDWIGEVGPIKENGSFRTKRRFSSMTILINSTEPVFFADNRIKRTK